MTRMKICLIGPTYPFRGGISHHSTLLFKYLKREHETCFFAFKRQYPQWLFPGKTDRDPSGHPVFDPDVVHLLDSLNPLTWLEVARKIRRVNPELVIFPWWTSFWAVQFSSIIYLIKRWTRAKILFICHNVEEHESTVFKRVCTKLVLQQGDLFLVHSREECSSLAGFIPKSRIIHGFHPTYKNLRKKKYDREKARKTLGINGKVLLFFGFVRPYKGLDCLLESIPAVLKGLGPDLMLLIVGEGWHGENEYREKIEKLGIEKHTLRINRYIPNEDIDLYFAAADLVVIPYVSATGSGILQIAYGCEKPVVASRVGCLADDVIDGKTGYLVAPGDPGELAAAIVKFFKRKKSDQFAANIKKMKDSFSWSRLVALMEDSIRSTG